MAFFPLQCIRVHKIPDFVKLILHETQIQWLFANFKALFNSIDEKFHYEFLKNSFTSRFPPLPTGTVCKGRRHA